jgi:hypothetical protein
MTPTIPLPDDASDLNLLMTLKLLSNEVAVTPDGPWAEDELDEVDEPPHATMTVPSARRSPTPPRRLSPSIFTSPRCGRDVDASPSLRMRLRGRSAR